MDDTFGRKVEIVPIDTEKSKVFLSQFDIGRPKSIRDNETNIFPRTDSNWPELLVKCQEEVQRSVDILFD